MSNSNIPIDVVIDILARLPIKSVLRFRCVCRSWCSIIHDPKFIQMHLNTRRTTANIDGYIVYKPMRTPSRCKHIFSRCDYKLSERERLQLPFTCASGQLFKIVGSCNGLICLTDNHHDHFGRIIYLWNPFLGKFKALFESSPSAVANHNPCSEAVLGLGFDSKHIDYKVVRVLYFPGALPDAEVYSLSTDSWRRIVAVAPSVTCSNSPHAFVNGASHWMATKNLGDACKFIMSFDYGDEAFGEIMLPDYLLDGDVTDALVGAFKESLSLMVYNENELFDMLRYIWVMKEYGVVDSWTKLFTIRPHEAIGRPISFGWNIEVLLTERDKGLVSHRPDIRESRCIGGVYAVIDVVTYEESLVLIKEGKDVFGQAKPFGGLTYKGISMFLVNEEEENCERPTDKGKYK